MMLVLSYSFCQLTPACSRRRAHDHQVHRGRWERAETLVWLQASCRFPNSSTGNAGPCSKHRWRNWDHSLVLTAASPSVVNRWTDGQTADGRRMDGWTLQCDVRQLRTPTTLSCPSIATAIIHRL